MLDLKDYFKGMGKKWAEIESGKGDIWEGTIILPSDWEPKYPAVEGKKKEMVEAIKEFIKEYFLEFDIDDAEDFKRLRDKKIILYIRDFYLWEDETMVLVRSKLSSYYAYININQNNQYDIWSDIKPLNWEVPQNFKLENYKGGDEFLRKFAKHYIKEEIQITKEDIEQWQRKHQKK